MKTNKAKRILTGAMAAAMSLSLCVPAFATTTTTPNKETAITGSFEEIPIAVTVPETATAKINPYGLPVEFTKSDKTTKAKISGQQITTAPSGITNDGEVDLKVSATVVGTQTGAFKFVNDAVTVLGNGSEGDPDYVAPSTLANGFVYLQGKLSATAAGGPTPEDKETVIFDICTATGGSAWASTYDPNKDIPVTTIAATAVAKELGTLKAATLTNGTVTAYPTGSIMAVRLAGVVTESPRTPWAETDGFTVNVSYTFKPVTTP